jgi:hypothetical protein
MWGADSLSHLPVQLAANLGMPVQATEDGMFVDYTLKGRLVNINI